ncbi:MAG: glycosyltransferase family 2 protein [Prolixibacteraceae bacterium]|nr:glycosyltransferase family 2 protein [Prolixibacteraceae bacterium]
MKFSIIIATYNSAGSVQFTLQSINYQTYKDFEVIIIDGMSSDNTIEIVHSFCPSAKIISEPDSGIYDALNKGMRQARGEWLYVLGSNDKFADEYVLQDVSNVVDNNVALIYGNVISVGKSWSKLIKMHPPEVYRAKKIKCPPIFHQSAFVNRKYIDETGYYPLFFRIHADHFLLSRLYHLSTPTYIDRVICIYNNEGYSRLSLKNYYSSSMEQVRINSFFGTKTIVVFKTLIKNFIRLIINIVKAIFNLESR